MMGIDALLLLIARVGCEYRRIRWMLLCDGFGVKETIQPRGEEEQPGRQR
jgi:hypothetical protein